MASAATRQLQLQPHLAEAIHAAFEHQSRLGISFLEENSHKLRGEDGLATPSQTWLPNMRSRLNAALIKAR